MTDKEKIRAEIERRIKELQPCNTRENLHAHGAIAGYYQILSFIDSMQKEEIPPKFPVISQKKCMYTKDDFTDEDRKVLCDGCKEDCEYAQKKESAREDYEIYGSVAAVKALDRKRVCPQLKGNALHKFKNEFNTIKQIVHLLYNYEDPFCYRVALHWASWGAYNLKSFGNINEKEKAKMDISEESISEDLEEASKEWLRPQLDKSYANYGETKMMELTHFDGYAMLDAIEFGAQWQKWQIVKEIKSRLVDAATNQDNSTTVAEETYYNGMVDALGRLRDKFIED